MAGKREAQQASDTLTPTSGKPKVRNFECPSCGASVTIRCPGQSLSCVCDSCKTVIDVTNNNYEILSQYHGKTNYWKPVIELGTRGELKGRKWEVIGFLVRMDVGSSFTWEEYLLFNPYYGYRWLTNNGGHWSFVTSIKKKPRSQLVSSINFEDRTHKLFYQGQASVVYVLGEFYWRVVIDTRVFMRDYICPPYMLSSEEDDKELTWSVSEYVTPGEVAEAFGLKVTDLPRPTGIAPNEPSRSADSWRKIQKMWFLFVIVITIMECFHIAGSSNKVAYSDSMLFKTNQKSTTSITTKPFQLEKDNANVEVKVTADVDNSWFYTAIDLVNDKTGDAYSMERSCEYYHGYSDGESWSEGSTTSSGSLSGIPGGTYYMNIDYESGSFPMAGIDKTVTISVLRDVPNYTNFGWALLFLSIIPIMSWWSTRSEEVQRWSQSDFSPYASSSSDD